MQLDLTPFIGLTGIPVIEQVVQYLRDSGILPPYITPFMALIIGVVLNVLLAWQLHVDLLTGFEVGLIAGFGASVWHEGRRQPSPPPVLYSPPLSPGTEH